MTTPVEEITEIAHEHNAQILLDGAQSVPHLQVDVRSIGCDYLAFSGHKMLGPTGVGILYARKEVQDNLEPPCLGGGTVKEVDLDSYRLVDSPHRFEAGTPPIAGMIGLGTAVDYLKGIDMANIEIYEKNLGKRMNQGLKEIPNVEIYGPEKSEQSIGLVSFNVGNLNPHDVAMALDISGDIMVRSGYHCCIPLVKRLLKQREGTVRASLYIYNTKEEVEKLISSVREIASSLA